MALVDTLDNLLMVGAYGWAFNKPQRKLYYNMTITWTSVVVALFIGGLEALGLIMDKFALTGGLWSDVALLSDNLGNAGFVVIGLFALCWLVSMVTRQSGHFFFEPLGFDEENQVSNEYKEAVKVGYNLKRKVVLLSIWAFIPVALWINPTFFGLFEAHSEIGGFIDHLGDDNVCPDLSSALQRAYILLPNLMGGFEEDY